MRRWLRFLLKAGTTVGVIVALIVAVDLNAILPSLQKAHWPWVLGAVLLLPLNLALEGGVWMCLLRSIDWEFSQTDVVSALLCGHALGFWTPVRAGEFAGRSLYFPSGKRGTISLSLVAQRMTDMAVGVAVGLLMLGLAFWSGYIPVSLPWLFAAGIGLCTGLCLSILLVNPQWGHQFAKWLAPNTSWITERTAFFQRITPGQGMLVLAGTGARYAVFSGQLICLAWALQPSTPLSSLLLAVGLTYYAKYLLPSLTLLDLGIREGAAAYFFNLLGIGTVIGLNAALLLFCINVLLPAMLGLPFIPQLSFLGDKRSPQSRLPTV